MRIDPVAWSRAADIFAVLIAIFLPWSTSLVAIAVVLFVLALLPTFDLRRFVQTLKRPESAIPLTLFALAAIGTLWATDISWAARLHGINPVAKLLLIPVLIYHFEKSSRGMWVFTGFLASCAALLVLSWGSYIFKVPTVPPGYLGDPIYGIPVKDYIAQNYEFALCVFGIAGAVVQLFRDGRSKLAYLLIALAVLFIANIVTVATSRTILVCIPVLFAVFCLRHFGKLQIVSAAVIAVLLTAAVWAVSPTLRERVNKISTEYQLYKSENASTSTGLRLEYWRKSSQFIEQSPLVGNGTGSIRTLFERDAVGKSGVSAEVVNNPHNQTLNVAIQWGVLGVIILWAMWLVHLRLFYSAGGLAAWIGVAAVVENIVSSAFNSHVFDFLEGWVYVAAVGVAAGMLRQQKLPSTRADAIS